MKSTVDKQPEKIFPLPGKPTVSLSQLASLR
jgi:hypothetical protein